MTASTKNESAKSEKPAPKAAAKEAPKSAPKATEKPKAAPKEAPKTQPENAAPAAEGKAAPAAEAPKTDSERPAESGQPMNLGAIFSEMLFGSAGKDEDAENLAKNLSEGLRDAFASNLLPESFDLLPEGFAFFPVDESDFCDASCGTQELYPEDVFAAGVAEGLSRAQHPAYGLARQAPVALPPIQVVDETTASFGHLVELQKLHVAGILTDLEYEGKKADILRRIY